MTALPMIRWRGEPVPQAGLVFVAVHVAAVATISVAAAWVGANAPATPIEPWMLTRASASARLGLMSAPAQAAPRSPVASMSPLADARALDLPDWLRQSAERDRSRPWVETPDGRVVMTR